ncbi:MAG: hypothetical protein BMS9Abin13_451 [Patescibacteria group bacterium]|nr:MAG: hypothetical protein BMS9Abin13_451 [Patescibacteria group bacterium]
MKINRLFFALLAVLLLISYTASAVPPPVQIPHVKRGDTARIPLKYSSNEVKIVNLTTTGNHIAGTSFSYGDLCVPVYPSIIAAVGVDGKKVLVRYTVIKKQWRRPPVFGNSQRRECPNNALFFIPKMEFANLARLYRYALKEERKERSLVRRLLEKG